VVVILIGSGVGPGYEKVLVDEETDLDRSAQDRWEVGFARSVGHYQTHVALNPTRAEEQKLFRIYEVRTRDKYCCRSWAVLG